MSTYDFSPQGYKYSIDPKSTHPFWGTEEEDDMNITATALVDDNTGIPEVTVRKTQVGENINFEFDFRNLKGAQGAQGAQGAPGADGSDGEDGVTPNITMSAQVDNTSGTPSVQVTKTGTAEAPSFDLSFSGLKGESGGGNPYQYNYQFYSIAGLKAFLEAEAQRSPEFEMYVPGQLSLSVVVDPTDYASMYPVLKKTEISSSAVSTSEIQSLSADSSITIIANASGIQSLAPTPFDSYIQPNIKLERYYNGQEYQYYITLFNVNCSFGVQEEVIGGPLFASTIWTTDAVYIRFNEDFSSINIGWNVGTVTFGSERITAISNQTVGSNDPITLYCFPAEASVTAAVTEDIIINGAFRTDHEVTIS